MTKKYKYRTNCVDSDDSEAITTMVDSSKDTTFESFAKNCDYIPTADKLGYVSGATPRRMHQDRHVTYRKSRYKGKLCFYFAHSGIEYVFTKEEV
jgi:hypothetical protein